MRRTLITIASALALLAASGIAQAAPLVLQMVQTSILYNEDPPGAPLPLGRTQYDAGDLLAVTGGKVGEYLRVKDVHAASLNVAAVTVTLFFGRTDPPFPITLQGVHSFNNGDESGSISASGAGFLGGVRFTVDGASDTLTIHFP